MNRLVLIGNGFDLAHGMKTSYNDFITDYVITSFSTSKEKMEFEDKLMKITKPHLVFKPINLSHFSTLDDYVNNLLLSKPSKRKDGSDFWGISVEKVLHPPPEYQWEIFNLFIKSLIEQCADLNWVDIENQYYIVLKSIVEAQIKVDKNALNAIKGLNETFYWLIQYLESYLSKLNVGNFNPDILKIFNNPICKSEVVTKILEKDSLPNSTMVLNFNYTSTIEQYIKKIPKDRRDTFEVNYIHGKLNDLDNPIIFGYGDEVDSHYLKMEELGVNSLFDYIKSFWYFKTSNYHNLIRFIESDDYQIYVMGHSCGLSDRTMLKMIFEHENCKSIKLHYYQTEDFNNFTELTQQISRHFTDKGLMRKKIVPFEKSISLPQNFI